MRNDGAQTVIGAISTGTHGYYRNGGVLAEAIIRLKAIDSSGKEREISDERELKAWRLSLGALGIITQITLAILPKKQWCHYHLNTLPRASFEQQLPYLCKAYEYFRFYPNHFDERYVNYLTITPFDKTTRHEIEPGIRFADDIPTIPWLTGLFKIAVQNRLFKAIIKTFDIANVTMSLVVPFSTLLFIKGGPVNKHYRIAASYYKAWDNPATHNMELAIAPEDYPRFAELFTTLLQQYRNKEPKFFAHYTSRYVGASDKALLAANYQRNVLFMDIHVPQYYIQAVKFLKEVEVTLREHCSVRVHWGKEFFAPAKDVLAAWPKEAIEQFVNIRQTCDPGGMFSNAYVRRLLDTTYRARFLG